ncbi:MAG: hypothetical protein M3R24_09190 [Chloroflexota bacterium]|nr:hypothetical protein [Chloroflexota bacterium]PLS80073.1 MAG: hypothetical protein CYG59_09895 [Chloroflexota bacterium]
MLRPLPFRFSLGILVLLGVVLGAQQALSQPPHQLRVVVPALPGDGALVMVPDGRMVLIDGSSDGAALATWLGNTLPFGQRSIDVVILTRVDAATLPGQLAALKRYRIGLALVPPTEHRNSSFDAWWQLLEQQHTPMHTITAHDRLALGQCELRVLEAHTGHASLALGCGPTTVYFLQSLDADGEAALEVEPLPPAQLVIYPWQRATKTTLLQRLQPQALLFSEGGAMQNLSWADRQIGTTALYHEAIHGQLQLVHDGRQLSIQVERTR